MAFCAASTRSRSQASSGGGIQRNGPGLDVLPEVRAEVGRRPEVDRPCPEQFGEFEFHARQPQETGSLPGMELDEKIDVALGAECIPEGGAEQSEAPDPVAIAEGRQGLSVDVDVRPDLHSVMFSRRRHPDRAALSRRFWVAKWLQSGSGGPP